MASAHTPAATATARTGADADTPATVPTACIAAAVALDEFKRPIGGLADMIRKI
jgi:hypothetical protein